MEIGSEFWKLNKKYISENEELFISGRTALDAIIKDILSEWRVESALLPSYCCHTMIEPFIRNQIPVRFYDVFVNEEGKLCADIPSPKAHEIFYDMKYYGSDIICREGWSDSEIRALWGLIIEDTTHSCFSGTHNFVADYEYTSYRKWMAFDGIAIARKRSGAFLVKPPGGVTNIEYCEKRNKAFEMKNSYMSGSDVNKSEFLELFRLAEKQLSETYVGLRPDMNTVIQYYVEIQNIDRICKKRLHNARILIDGLKDIEELTVIIDVSNSQVCPLFVPIVVSSHMRDLLKQYLIRHEIYCPVHWPLSKMHKGITLKAELIYHSELSLICDQRYGDEDMLRELILIKNFFAEYRK